MDNIVTTNKNSHENAIEGLVVSQLTEFSDPRGSVLHMLRCDEPAFTQFGECYFSEILPGVVKAWKCHRIQTQNLAVPVGQIRTLVYDNREGSATCGQVESIEMGRPNSYLRLGIPPGLWYGFECLGDSPALIVNCPDIPHNPKEGEVRSITDPQMPQLWGVQEPNPTSPRQ